jgi:DNA-binding SARP family transcriptional activator/ABC-type transport system substrate-binding protein/streptogramin lyase
MGGTAFPHGSLQIGILGPFEATRDSERLSLGGRQQRAILALLVCEAGHAVSRERLVDALWGEAARPGAVTSLQTYVFHLREALEPDRRHGSPGSILVTANGGYRLEVSPSSVDAARFEHLAAKADDALAQSHPELALTLYEEALSTWRGDVLADLADYDFVAPVRARLDEMHASALESRIQAQLDLGRHAAVVAELAQLMSDHPLRERFHAQLILALYRCGRQSDALAAYRALRSTLDTELGIEPSPPLQELNQRVLAQDPALDWNPPAPSRVTPRATQQHREPALTSGAGPSGQRATWVRSRWLPILIVLVLMVGALSFAVAKRPWLGPQTAQAIGVNAVNELDETGSVLASVPVGTNPVALAAARGMIWVINAGDNTVSQVNPKSHTVQRELDVGHDPQSLAVTGDDLWVSNFADGTVTRINLVAAKVVQSIHVGSAPAAIAAGPAGLWVANSGDNTIQRIDTITGATHVPVDVGDGPDGLAVDASSVWVANGRAGSVTHIDGRTGDQMSAPIRVGSGPRGIVRAGDDVWVADELSQSITRIKVATLQTHSIDVGDGPTALGLQGGAVWVAEKYSGDLFRIDRATEKRTRFAARGAVRGLAVFGGHVWVSSGAVPASAHRGGTLRIAGGALPGQISGLDPPDVYDRTALHVNRVVYDGLLAYHYSSADPQVLIPDLATSVPEPTDGDRIYTFNLRPSIRYSTGRLVKASDVVRGVRRALRSTTARPDFFAGIVGGQACIDDVGSCGLKRGVVADDAAGRVTFHLKAPDPMFLHKLTLMVVPAPPGTPLHRLKAPLPGTGPYRIASFTQGKTLSLARNRFFHQWSAGAQPGGFVDRITWVRVANAQEAAHAVTQGQADLAELTPLGGSGPAGGSLVDQLRIEAPSRVHSNLTQGTAFGVLNSSIPPFDKLRARQAFNYAVDRRRVVRLLGGPSVVVPACQLVPPSMPSYAPYCPYTRHRSLGGYRGPDLAAARRLVRLSGTYGTKVTVTDLIDDPSPPLDAYFAHVLRRLGYRVTIHGLPNNPRNQHFAYDPGSGIQVESGGWYADFPLPSNFYDLVSCAGAGYPLSYCNKDLDRRAAAAASQMQTDPGAALRAWTAINRVVTDQAPLVPVTNDVNWWLTSERVGNYQRGGVEIGPMLSQLWVR